MNDGFVLRNVQAEFRAFETSQFALVASTDIALLSTISPASAPSLTLLNSHPPTSRSLSDTVSTAVGRFTSHALTVLVGFLVIVGLLAGSSALKWNETGQLLCNIPPSIIESFFMTVLITGHNVADAERRAQLRKVYATRVWLSGVVDAL